MKLKHLKEIKDFVLWDAELHVSVGQEEIVIFIMGEYSFGKHIPSENYLKWAAILASTRYMRDWQKDVWVSFEDRVYSVHNVTRVQVFPKPRQWKIGIAEEMPSSLYGSPSFKWRALAQ